MVADDEKKQYDDCCEVFRKFAEIDKEGRIMKRVAITLYISLATLAITLFLLNDIDASLTGFLASAAIVMSIEALDDKKLAVMAVPLYVALAVAIHHAIVLFLGLEKPLRAQVIEILVLIGIIAASVSMAKTLFLDSNKPRESRLQPS